MKRLALAAAVALIASGALAQTQPVPTAIAPGGQTMNSTPSAIIVAPAGGAGGKGTVVAPDHPLPVTGSFTLPSGAATAAKQDTGNTSAASIDGKLTTTNTTLGTLATAAAQTTGNTSLGSIDGKLSTTNTTLGTLATAAGQATASGTLTTIANNTASNATAANQTATQANAGSDASKALAVQGVTGGKPVSVSDTTSSTTNRSITVTTGGTAQQVMASNASRRSFYVFNPNTSGICWGSFTTTTPVANGLGAFPIPSLGGFGMENNTTTAALYVNCPVTGQFVTAWESQ